MSVYSKDPDEPLDDHCTFCDSTMHRGMGGEWRTLRGVVFCCTQCAVKHLAPFLADSLFAKDLMSAWEVYDGRVAAAIEHAFAARAEFKQWNT